MRPGAFQPAFAVSKQTITWESTVMSSLICGMSWGVFLLRLSALTVQAAPNGQLESLLKLVPARCVTETLRTIQPFASEPRVSDLLCNCALVHAS